MKITRAKDSSYNCGRMLALLLAVTLLGVGAFFQSKLRESIPVETSTISKDRPRTVFQLEPEQSLSGKRKKDDDATWFSTVAHEQSFQAEIKDNLAWYSGKSAQEMYKDELEWYRFSQGENGPNKQKAKKRLLIGQYSNKNDFSQIFDLTKPINKAYAERWNHDIVFLNGQNTSRKKVNMAAILRLAWENKDKYDQLLLLDADAMMNNFRVDITRAFPASEMVTAQRIFGNDDEHTWAVFGTVSLWNLHHLLTPRVQRVWSDRFRAGDVEAPLQDQVKPYAETEVFTVTRQIGHEASAYISTFQFFKKGVSQDISFKSRLEKWKKTTAAKCKRYGIKCAVPQERRRAAEIQRKPSLRKAS